MKLLIVSAMQVELDAIRAELAANPSDVAKHVEFAPLGMGKVNAGLNLFALLLQYEADAVLLYGTAGGLRGDLEPGKLYPIEQTWQHDYGLRSNDGFTTTEAGVLPSLGLPPKPYVVHAGLQTFLQNRHPELDWRTTVTGDSFVSSDDDAARLACSADLVDMETAVFAQVATEQRIPWLALRSVSDAANNDAANDFAESVKTLHSPVKGIAKVIDTFLEYVATR